MHMHVHLHVHMHVHMMGPGRAGMRIGAVPSLGGVAGRASGSVHMHMHA